MIFCLSYWRLHSTEAFYLSLLWILLLVFQKACGLSSQRNPIGQAWWWCGCKPGPIWSQALSSAPFHSISMFFLYLPATDFVVQKIWALQIALFNFNTFMQLMHSFSSCECVCIVVSFGLPLVVSACFFSRCCFLLLLVLAAAPQLGGDPVATYSHTSPNLVRFGTWGHLWLLTGLASG